MRPRVGIVYLSYHCEPHFDAALAAIAALEYPRERLDLIVVDQPHPEHGSSAAFIENTIAACREPLPNVHVLARSENSGFAGGMNAGLERARILGCEFAFLHNDDGALAPEAIGALVEALEADPRISAAQSLILLDPERELVNSAGNALHYCFFGYCRQYREPVKAVVGPAVEDVVFASGAALLVRLDSVERTGGFDEDLRLYCEDLEFCLRRLLLGERVAFVRRSVFYHRYAFGRNADKLYWLERNRVAVILMTLRLPTLALLLPMLFVLECGLLLFAAWRGWLPARLRAYRYWMSPAHWRLWWRKRRQRQRTRRISDRQLLLRTSATLRFADEAVDNPLLTFVGNPLMAIYYNLIVRTLLWW